MHLWREPILIARPLVQDAFGKDPFRVDATIFELKRMSYLSLNNEK